MFAFVSSTDPSSWPLSGGLYHEPICLPGTRAIRLSKWSLGGRGEPTTDGLALTFTIYYVFVCSLMFVKRCVLSDALGEWSGT